MRSDAPIGQAVVLLVEQLMQMLQRRFRLRRDRVFVVVVRDYELAVFFGDTQFAARDHFPTMVIENGQEHLVPQAGRRRVPINVEELRVIGTRPMPQHVHPPFIGKRATHVVGHHVQQQSEAAFARGCAEFFKTVEAAKRRTDFPKTADVVTVRALRARAEQRRRIAMAYAEFLEVIQHFLRLLECEVAVELQPVRCRRHARGTHITRSQPPVRARAAAPVLQPGSKRI